MLVGFTVVVDDQRPLISRRCHCLTVVVVVLVEVSSVVVRVVVFVVRVLTTLVVVVGVVVVVEDTSVSVDVLVVVVTSVTVVRDGSVINSVAVTVSVIMLVMLVVLCDERDEEVQTSHLVGSLMVLSRYELQSARPSRVGKAEPIMARRQLFWLQSGLGLQP